jgi:hypothetical protein
LRQWQGTLEYLERHRAKVRDQEEKIIGQVGGPFEYNRRQLLDSVGRAAKEVVMTYDREAEARQLAQGVRDAVAGVAVVELGAVGLGAILLAILHGALLDFTGLLSAGALALVGLLILPAKRRRAKNDLNDKLEDLRERLMKAMGEEFELELAHSLQRLREAIAPYTRFVRSEQDKLSQVEKQLGEISSALGQLLIRVENL